jgi:hypothetical protein
VVAVAVVAKLVVKEGLAVLPQAEITMAQEVQEMELLLAMEMAEVLVLPIFTGQDTALVARGVLVVLQVQLAELVQQRLKEQLQLAVAVEVLVVKLLMAMAQSLGLQQELVLEQ